MEIKILQVFYGKDGLPYKDKDRQVHFPIAGTGFLGASNTTKIKFYYDELDDLDETTWVAVSKLPNGKVGSRVLESHTDSELNEHYVLLELDSYYTQYKGDVFISLQGYQGGVNVDYNEETSQYEIHGTPTIAATGSIKFTINYANQFVGSGETDNINFQRILSALGTKLGMRAYSEHVEELPSEGSPDIFYVVNDEPNNPNLANIYVWNENTRHYIWVGDNTLDLGEYYTKEQGDQFESNIDNRVTFVENELSNVVSGSPKGVYATLSDLESAYPTGTTGIYVVSATGHWYYWNGSAWTDGGVYQAAELNDFLIPNWQPATDYYLGDLVYYNGVAYKCNVDYERSVTFNSSNWQQVNLQSYVENYTQEQKDVNDTLIKNLLLIDMFEDGYYRSYADGYKRELSNFSVTKLLEVKPNKNMYFTGGQVQIAFYNASRVFISGDVLYNSSFTPDGSITTPANCKYIAISIETSKKSNTSLVYGNELEITIPADDFGGQKMREYISSKNILRNNAIFGTWTDNQYIPASSGQATDLNGWSWKKINVENGGYYYINKESHIAFFNGNTYVSGVVANQYGQQNHYVKVPSNCNVMSVSVSSTNKDSLIILEKKWHDVITSNLIFEVGSQRREFTRVFDCLEFIRENDIENAEVKIDAGTYDLIAEITASKGASYISSYTTTDTFKGLFLGHNIHIVGKGKVKITANYTGSNTDFSSQVSVFHVYDNTFFMENIEVDVAGLRYAIHDDSHDNYPWYNEKGEIKNCKFVNNGVTYGSLIGGGLFHNDLRIIDNCVFIDKTNTNNFRGAYYHTNADSYECTVKISNCYTENCLFGIVANGSSAYTSEMYVSNCKTNTPFKSVDSGYTDNVELYYWNIETNYVNI